MSVTQERNRAVRRWLQNRWGGRYRMIVRMQHAVPVELSVGIGALLRDEQKSQADYWSLRGGCIPPCSHNLVLQ